MRTSPIRWCVAAAFILGMQLVSAPGVQGIENIFYDVRGRESQNPTGARVMEAETSFIYKSPTRYQDMKGFGPNWGGNAHLLWDGKIGDRMPLEFNLWQSGKFSLQIQLTKAPDYGIFDLAINGKDVLKGIDLYDPKVVLGQLLTIEGITLPKGQNNIVFSLVGGHPNAIRVLGERHLIGFDFMRLEPLDAPEPAGASESEFVESVRDISQAVDEYKISDGSTIDFSEIRGHLETYCIGCHGDKKTKGKVNLEHFSGTGDYAERLELTGTIVDVLTRYEMPPDDEDQPGENVRRQLVQFFQETIDTTVAEDPQLAKVTMRRMNRYEYNNSVRDLLGLKGDIYPLPEKPIREATPYFNPGSGNYPDNIQVGNRPLGKFQIEQQILDAVFPFAIDLQAEHGFNNQGNLISFSPILLENFLNLSRAVLNSSQFKNYCGRYEELFEFDGRDSEEAKESGHERLMKLMERAFREPVSKQVSNRYLNYFSAVYDATDDFTESMKSAMAAILSSPRFLFINNASPEDEVEKLNDYELATRLSFFLWSSIPDQELIDLARAQKLSDQNVFSEQVRRMLEHPQSQSLSQNFARQWLRMDKLIASAPDFERFEIYYSRIGCEQWKFGLQMMMEPLLLFESIMVEDRSIMLLIDSDYTYRSDELQSWYNDRVPFGARQNRNRFNTFSQTFRRRPVGDPREGGVITSAAVLTMTSDPLRTNPILRGSWMAGVIFNNPPQPPPDVVPELEADDEKIEAEGLTLRQKLIAHQTNESCRTCHAKIDPLGFALENYDAIGRWRDKYRSGLEIDTTGEYNDMVFSNVIELKQQLLDNPDLFIRAFCEHMLSYALGRELDVYDKPAIDKITRNVMLDKGKFSTIIEQIATSFPFLHKSDNSE